MKDLLISIIIPVYNTEKYLRKCLDSVVNQSYSNLEIIVVNDGSTDNSLDILHEYKKKDSRIQIKEQKNRGVSAARNLGLEYVTGSYVMFLDSDDWIDLNTCEVAMEFVNECNLDILMWSYIREYSNKSKKNFILGSETCIWEETEFLNLKRQLIGLVKDELIHPEKIDSIVTVWGKLYKYSKIKNIRFIDTQIIGAEDLLYNVEVFFKMNSAGYLPKTLNHYRKDNINSLTKRYKKDLVVRWLELYRRIEEILDKECSDIVFYEALSNRISLGLIGIGLNLVEDRRLNFVDKRRELKQILVMPCYQKALSSLEFQYFPIHWKFFFWYAKKGRILKMCLLLYIMNYLRGK